MINAVFELTLHLSLRVCELRASAASSKGHKTSNSLNLKWRKKVYPSPWWLSLPLSPATLSLLPDAAVPAPTTRICWRSSSTLKLQVWGEGNRWAKMPKQNHLRTARCHTPGGQSHFFSLNATWHLEYVLGEARGSFTFTFFSEHRIDVHSYSSKAHSNHTLFWISEVRSFF